MDVTPLVREGLQLIQSYSDKGFKITGTAHESAVFVFPDVTTPWLRVSDVASLNPTHFEALVAQKEGIDVLLIGTGKRLTPLPADLLKHLHENGLYPDVMDTGAACRTFNVLVAEGRRVVAALLVNL